MCPRGCSGLVYLHGFYWRCAHPEVSRWERTQRYRCPGCGLTFSVMPPYRPPYRAVRAKRLQRDFDRRGGSRPLALDPPTRALILGSTTRPPQVSPPPLLSHVHPQFAAQHSWDSLTNHRFSVPIG